MPMLDPSHVILDPMFCEAISVLRRAETVNSFGESEVTETVFAPYAVVTAGAQPGMVRGSDGQVEPDNIVVHSQFRMVGPAEGLQPDVVRWRNRSYVVTRTYDYSHYGVGFVSAECASMDYLDSA